MRKKANDLRVRQSGAKSTTYLAVKNTMGSDYGFTKIWVGKSNTKAARSQILDLFDHHSRSKGLLPVGREDAGAHFTFMLVDAGTGWLHFDSAGHYANHYERFQPEHNLRALLSQSFPVISFFCSDGASYGIQHWQKGQVIARYRSSFFMDRKTFNDPEAAQKWYPVFQDWQALLPSNITEADFLETLPAPIHASTIPDQPKYKPYDHYPQNFARLFGWEPGLNGACVEFNPEGNSGRGGFYHLEAGDYTVVTEADEYEGISSITVTVNARHYAHPNPGKVYVPTFDEDTNVW